MTAGVFRDEDQVYVSYDGRTPVAMSAQHYIRRGYEPPLGDLPTREEHERPGLRTLIAERRQAKMPGSEAGQA